MKKMLAVVVALTGVMALAQAAAPVPPEQPPPGLMGLFVQYVAPVLFTGLASLLTWVFAQLGLKLKAQATGSKAAMVADKLLHFAQLVVADLDATLKPELLKAAADGVLTTAEITHLRDVALSRLKALAGEQGLKEVQSVLGVASPQLDKYLTGLVEHAVGRLPESTPVPPPAAPRP